MDNHDRLQNKPSPYDAATHEKLAGSPVAKETAEVPVLTGPTVEIVTKNGGTVNVRVGNGVRNQKKYRPAKYLITLPPRRTDEMRSKWVRRQDGFGENTARRSKTHDQRSHLNPD